MIRFVKMRMFAPRTAARLGVMPHSEILKRIAESAMLFTTIVITDSRRRIHISARLLFPFDVSATEKKIIAITPTSRALKIIRNSLSLYGSFPDIIIAPRKTRSITSTSGLNIFAITGDTFPTSCGLVCVR